MKLIFFGLLVILKRYLGLSFFFSCSLQLVMFLCVTKQLKALFCFLIFTGTMMLSSLIFFLKELTLKFMFWFWFSFSRSFLLLLLNWLRIWLFGSFINWGFILVLCWKQPYTSTQLKYVRWDKLIHEVMTCYMFKAGWFWTQNAQCDCVRVSICGVAYYYIYIN